MYNNSMGIRQDTTCPTLRYADNLVQSQFERWYNRDLAGLAGKRDEEEGKGQILKEHLAEDFRGLGP